MKKVRIAQIGTSKNGHGNHIWHSLNKQRNVFDVVGIAFPENEKEKYPRIAAGYKGFREMSVEEILSDPRIEAVAVETEEIYLTKYALMAAKAGKHVHMEKPGGVDITDFRELIDILKSKRTAFSMGYMYRFNPKIKEVFEKIENGELGRIYAVEAHMSAPHDGELREWLNKFPGGMLFYLGCHLIDLIYRIQGEPDEIIPLNTSTNIGDIHSEDYGMVVYKYQSGVSFAKTCAVERGSFLRRQLVICGEKGTVELKPLEVVTDGGLYTVCSECRHYEWHKPWNISKSGLYDRYDDMMRNFAELVRGKENPYSYDYELGLYELILKSCGKVI